MAAALEEARRDVFDLLQDNPPVRRCLLRTFASDPFLLSGDALLLQAFLHPRSGWTQSDPQLLAVVHVVVDFLELLRERGGRFKVIWVREAEWRGLSAFALRVVRRAIAHDSCVVASFADLLACARFERPAWVGISTRWSEAVDQQWCGSSLARDAFRLAIDLWATGGPVTTGLLELDRVVVTGSSVLLGIVRLWADGEAGDSSFTTTQAADFLVEPVGAAHDDGGVLVDEDSLLSALARHAAVCGRPLDAFVEARRVARIAPLEARALPLTCDDESCMRQLDLLRAALDAELGNRGVSAEALPVAMDLVDLRLVHAVMHVQDGTLESAVRRSAPQPTPPAHSPLPLPMLNDPLAEASAAELRRAVRDMFPDSHTHRLAWLQHGKPLKPSDDLRAQLEQADSEGAQVDNDELWRANAQAQRRARKDAQRLLNRIESLHGGFQRKVICRGGAGDPTPPSPTASGRRMSKAEAKRLKRELKAAAETPTPELQGMLDELCRTAPDAYHDALWIEDGLQKKLQRLPGAGPRPWAVQMSVRATAEVFKRAKKRRKDSGTRRYFARLPLPLVFDEITGRLAGSVRAEAREFVKLAADELFWLLQLLDQLQRHRVEICDAALVCLITADLAYFGFVDFALETVEFFSNNDDASVRIRIRAEMQATTKVDFGISLQEFQLRFLGSRLLRPRGQPDARVGFRPDPWQTRLLDVIDRGDSALVIQPTSAGKSFSAYYAIEQVLKGHEHGKVVYLCPTKALCLSVASEIQALYCLEGGDQPPVVGMFSKDFRFPNPNWWEPPVLVTVPQCYSLIFNSPSPELVAFNAAVKVVIFDEVHHIAQAEGSVWEEMLLSLPREVQLLALSATVGQPEAFAEWLRHLRPGRLEVLLPEAQSNDDDERDRLAVERFNDLEPVYFCESTAELRAVHPAAALQPGNMDAAATENLCMTPEHGIALYDALRCHGVAAPSPEQFFRERPIVPLAWAHWYGRKLLEALIAAPERRRVAVVERLRTAVVSAAEVPEFVPDERGPSDNDGAEPPVVPLRAARDVPGIASLIECLVQLRRRHMVPCIVFLLNKNQCDILAAQLALAVEADDDISFRPSGQNPLTGAEVTKAFCGDELRAPELVRWLHAGVGVHHANWKLAQREAVEYLFRKRRIGVVISTGTLAQGINMPARSVVFFRDSIWLTASLYRQCGGRAGRRGMDWRGLVVHCSVPKQRVLALARSGPAPLTGHVLVTPALAMRKLLSLARLDRHDARQRIVQSFRSVMYDGFRPNPRNHDHLAFAMHCLRALDLVDGQSHPQPLADLLGHLHWAQDGAVALVWLLRTHPECVRSADDALKLLQVLFCREQSGRRGQALEVPMKTKARLVRCASDLKQKLVDFYSGLCVEPSTPLLGVLPALRGGDYGDATVARLAEFALPCRARDPFTALRGEGDAQLTRLEPDDLVRCLRPEFRVSRAHIPVLSGIGRRVSGYLRRFLDQRKAGVSRDEAVEDLEATHGIQSKDAWVLLRDFYDISRAVSVAVRAWAECVETSTPQGQQASLLALHFHRGAEEVRNAYRYSPPSSSSAVAPARGRL